MRAVRRFAHAVQPIRKPSASMDKNTEGRHFVYMRCIIIHVPWSTGAGRIVCPGRCRMHMRRASAALAPFVTVSRYDVQTEFIVSLDG